MKRTKQMTSMIEDANDYLRNNRITALDDPLFLVLTHSLSRSDIYRGFQWKKTGGYTQRWNPFDGVMMDIPYYVTCTEEEGEFLEIL